MSSSSSSSLLRSPFFLRLLLGSFLGIFPESCSYTMPYQTTSEYIKKLGTGNMKSLSIPSHHAGYLHSYHSTTHYLVPVFHLAFVRDRFNAIAITSVDYKQFSRCSHVWMNREWSWGIGESGQIGERCRDKGVDCLRSTFDAETLWAGWVNAIIMTHSFFFADIRIKI